MKKITIILALIILASCSSYYIEKYEDIENTMYYGTNNPNLYIEKWPYIFADIKSDSAIVKAIILPYDNNSAYSIKDTLLKYIHNDTLYKNSNSAILLENNKLCFVYIKDSTFWFYKNGLRTLLKTKDKVHNNFNHYSQYVGWD